MSRRSQGLTIGWLGLICLLTSYVRLFAFKFLSPGWSEAILASSIIGFVAFLIAARLLSRWWYFGALASVLSGVLVLAFVGG